MAYIDVRGVWPCYVNGMITFLLEGYPRDITIEQAKFIYIRNSYRWTEANKEQAEGRFNRN